MAAGILVVVGTVAVVDTAAVECIPAAAADTLVVAWPTAAATDIRANRRILLQKQTEGRLLTANSR
jgi:hypothetical protein